MFSRNILTQRSFIQFYSSSIISYSYFCTKSKHSDKILKVKKKFKTNNSKDKIKIKKPLKTINHKLQLSDFTATRSTKKIQSIEEDSDLNNPEIMQQVEELEKEHFAKHGKPKFKDGEIVDYDIPKIDEGDHNIDEEEEELNEKFNNQEPAYSINKYTDQLRKATSFKDLKNIPISFTPEDFINMLERDNANDINLLDVRSKSEEFDYLIIATLLSNRHRKALGNYIHFQVKKRNQLAIELGSPYVKQFLAAAPEELSQVSNDSPEWVCVDCGAVIIHLFSPETRKEYNLDYYWEHEVKEYNAEEELQKLIKNEAFLLHDNKRASKKQPKVIMDELDKELGDSSDGSDTDW